MEAATRGRDATSTTAPAAHASSVDPLEDAADDGDSRRGKGAHMHDESPGIGENVAARAQVLGSMRRGRVPKAGAELTRHAAMAAPNRRARRLEQDGRSHAHAPAIVVAAKVHHSSLNICLQTVRERPLFKQ